MSASPKRVRGASTKAAAAKSETVEQLKDSVSAEAIAAVQPQAPAPDFSKMEEFGRNARLGERSRTDAAWYILEEAMRGAANPSNVELYVAAFVKGTGKDWAKRSIETLEANMRHMAHPRVVLANEGGKLKLAFESYLTADKKPLKEGYGGFSRSQTGKDEFGCLSTFCRYISTLDNNVVPMLDVESISRRLISTKTEAEERKRKEAEEKAAKDAADPDKQKALESDRKKALADTFAKVRPATLTDEQKALIAKFNEAFGLALLITDPAPQA